VKAPSSSPGFEKSLIGRKRRSGGKGRNWEQLRGRSFSPRFSRKGQERGGPAGGETISGN